jgi:formate hydrogenlyase subunit 6/NADH:ubiquinone oxidoreductase subunit I
MTHPGALIRQILSSIFKKPATTHYPFTKAEVPDRYRGKIKFNAPLCIGCKICMRDCPSNAITITKVGEKEFQCEIDLAKCIYCGQCVDSCPKKALECTNEFELAVLDGKKLKAKFDAAKPSQDGKDKDTGASGA